jgi:hypothetical protein
MMWMWDAKWDANAKSIRETQKALVVCLYAWAFFAVTLGVATCVHLAQSLF